MCATLSSRRARKTALRAWNRAIALLRASNRVAISLFNFSTSLAGGGDRVHGYSTYLQHLELTQSYHRRFALPPSSGLRSVKMTDDNKATVPTRRLASLDALRGIAACVVVLGHCYMIIPEQPRAQFEGLFWSPLRPFRNADAAVIIFFVLSGYVLAIPYLRGTQLSYPSYVIRRVCRIYIPFAASIVFALLLYSFASRQQVAGASEWFNTLWPSVQPGFSVLVNHLLMLGTGPDMALNPPMWTLVYEMRISLLFPLLIILCRDTRIAVVAAPVLLVAATRHSWRGRNSCTPDTCTPRSPKVFASPCFGLSR